MYSLLVNKEVHQTLFDPTDKRWDSLTGSSFTEFDILIVDNLQLISKFYFEQMDKLCRKARNSQLPFGGLQIILAGDPLSMPPVDYVSKDERAKVRIFNHDYCFKADVWRMNPPGYIYLTDCNHVFNGDYLKVLQALRNGNAAELQRSNLFIGICVNDRVRPEQLEYEECYVVPFKSNAEEVNHDRMQFCPLKL
jgi:hypothetical protein